jgi:hypothetical protein
VFEGGERLGEGHAVVPGVQLPEVDVVGAEAFERAVEGGEQGAAGGAAAERAVVAAGDRFRGEDDVVAGHEVAEQ